MASASFKELKGEYWSFSSVLRPEHVWQGVMILALLQYKRVHQSEQLVVPHDGEQLVRFDLAMKSRNEHIVQNRQPELPHYCNKCLRVYADEGGFSK